MFFIFLVSFNPTILFIMSKMFFHFKILAYTEISEFFPTMFHIPDVYVLSIGVDCLVNMNLLRLDCL